jgi:hypothetical protein
MTPTTKRLISTLLKGLALPFSLMPGGARVGLISGGRAIDSRRGQPEAALRRQFALLDMAERLIAERATAYGGGNHPSTPDRYTTSLSATSPSAGPRRRCGYGAVARSVAERVADVTVVGIVSTECAWPRPRRQTSAQTFGSSGLALVDLPKGRGTW